VINAAVNEYRMQETYRAFSNTSPLPDDLLWFREEANQEATHP
jgi:hypothetical protein